MHDDTDRDHQIASIRLVLDMLEQSPDIPMPLSWQSTVQYSYVWGKEEQRRAAKALRTFRKAYSDEYYDITRDFGVISFIIRTPRKESCKATVVGTETVTRTVCVTPAVYEEREVEVDVVEWDCAPSLYHD